MPFNWTININNPKKPAPSEAQFDPNPLTQVAPGDQIFWANNDDCAH